MLASAAAATQLAALHQLRCVCTLARLWQWPANSDALCWSPQSPYTGYCVQRCSACHGLNAVLTHSNNRLQPPGSSLLRAASTAAV